ncbi:hypothetical protein [Pontibacter cellulosilyticus]|uniref:Uncharacterized protein n=1 Tax=Pontibacter cellulosilyticus TaxID=1720253 RepID=A0A923N797_9BACT|nr:hypothetical protein [Pontibacter cellulosilyticus]MBC5993531.1 hypothetical protein [Pontibacter cellulosilyticus]
MDLQGWWTKDEEGYMEFETSQLQRFYEAVTESYHRVYNSFLDENDDDDEAYYKALERGYEMVTDYKTIDGISQFATTYNTPEYLVDVWYGVDEETGKKVYNKGFLRINRN